MQGSSPLSFFYLPRRPLPHRPLLANKGSMGAGGGEWPTVLYQQPFWLLDPLRGSQERLRRQLVRVVNKQLDGAAQGPPFPRDSDRIGNGGDVSSFLSFGWNIRMDQTDGRRRPMLCDEAGGGVGFRCMGSQSRQGWEGKGKGTDAFGDMWGNGGRKGPLAKRGSGAKPSSRTQGGAPRSKGEGCSRPAFKGNVKPKRTGTVLKKRPRSEPQRSGARWGALLH